MIGFLKKVRVKTLFSLFDPVKVEPLELCYLEAVLDSMGIECHIADDLFGLKEPKEIKPDVIVLTGYNVAEEEIILEAGACKAKYPGTIVIVGGVHAQLNASAFHHKNIDYVIHSQCLSVFKQVIGHISDSKNKLIEAGVDYFIDQAGSTDGIWKVGGKHYIKAADSIKADRRLFRMISPKTSYLEKKQVALIKGSIGCPYGCEYCYCRCVNGGIYIKSDYDKMVEEMADIEAEYFWIVDDVLFAMREDALAFIEAVSKIDLKVKIIGYLRADFIIKEADLLPRLKKAGLAEVIVGFESVNNEELEDYHKSTDALRYPEAISLLKENSIDLTALFMVHPDYSLRDFIDLRDFIRKHDIDVYTISVFTPIKGTSSYEKVKKDLITQDLKKYDFLHLVLKPRLPVPLFYILFYWTHLRLLKSKRIWKYISRHNS